jgi:glycosyltransferase involved in cell wall biosynthesis
MIVETKTISIIVPIYNVEKYLRECLESIKNQTYKDIEVLMICGISNDNSTEIAKEYEKEDNRFKYIFRENNGLADARNVGISNAKGKYLIFVDSDDWIDLDTIENMFKIAQTERAEIVVGTYTPEEVADKSLYGAEMLDINVFSTKDIDKIIRHISEIKFSAGAWHYLVDMDFIVKNNLFFDKLRYVEDVLWTARLLCFASSIALYPKAFYHYRIREGSLSQDLNSKSIVDLLYSCIKMNEIRHKLTSKEKINYVHKSTFKYFSHCISQYYKLKKPDKKIVRRAIKDNKKDILEILSYKKAIRFYVRFTGIIFGVRSGYKIYKMFVKN